MKDAAWLAVFLLLFLAIFLIGQRSSHRWKTHRRPSSRTRPPRFGGDRERPYPTRHSRPWRPAIRFDRDHQRDLLAAKQLRAVSVASFQRRKILNSGESRVFKIIENELNSIRRGHRAFPQTNLGEILACPDDEAFSSVNSKRVDILVVDSGGWPVLAVEYQGQGHYGGTAIARDTIKSMALRSAGIGYMEIFERDGDNEIRVNLREQLAGNRRGPDAAGFCELA